MWSFPRALGLLLLPWLGAGVVAAEESASLPRDRAVTVQDFDAKLLAVEIFRRSNEVRVLHGVAALKPEPRLVAAAEEQAATLAMRIHSGHDSPILNHADPAARAAQAGLPPGAVAENAATLNATNRETGATYTYAELAGVIVQAWMDSPGHRANLLNPQLVYLGCGARVTYLLANQPVVYAIQDFYTPSRRQQDPIEVPVTEVLPGGPHLTR